MYGYKIGVDMKLHLGCGENIKEGYINHDIYKDKGVDITFDLNKLPYPFKDNEFEEIFSEHVLEHLDSVEKTLSEWYRISKSGAIIKIRIPHHASGNAYIDPTHKQFFNSCYFKNIINKPNGNRRMKSELKYNYEIIKLKITLVWWAKPLEPIINLIKGFYDYSLCYIIRPSDIVLELKVLK